jgi:tryptophan synthase alpha chain
VSRIESCFRRLGAEGRTALVPYVTAGDPDPRVTTPLMHAMVEAGADIIELGVPFSDPMADGPVIQRASERALRHHVSLHNVLDMVARFRERDGDTPIVLMGYLNPVEAMGYAVFARAAADAGVDGILTVDMPPEEGGELIAALEAAGLDPIFLTAPTTTAERMDRICAAGRGFLYYVSLKGVTGAANLDIDSVRERIAELRRHTGLPVGVGFGIRDAASAAQVAAIADAVVVGSALVRLIAGAAEAGVNDEALIARVSERLREMRAAIDEREPSQQT